MAEDNGVGRTLKDKGVTRAWRGRPMARASLYKPIGWGWPLCSSGGQVLMGTVFRYVGAPGGFQVRSFLELRSDDILEVALDRGYVGASEEGGMSSTQSKRKRNTHPSHPRVVRERGSEEGRASGCGQSNLLLRRYVSSAPSRRRRRPGIAWRDSCILSTATPN